MTVTAVRKDPQALSLTLDAEFDASPERVWQLWADPRQLERWWGPPTYPATVTKHELRPGGRVEYHMTGPEGDQPHAYWNVEEVDPPRSLVVSDGFANEDGSPNTDLPKPVPRHNRRDRSRPHPDVDRQQLSQHRGDGAAHGFRWRGPEKPWADRRDPRDAVAQAAAPRT
jgi:uncharacterized protein YndB with AHSA1/START domain